jgi:hypothetical protein
MIGKQRVFVLQRVQEDPAGRVGSLLDEYEVFYNSIHVGEDQLPDPTRFDTIVVPGGAAHLYWNAPKKSISRDLTERNPPQATPFEWQW